MEHNPLKQRLIGAIVLVALAVIFIPMLLNGGRGDKGVSFGTNIPPKPSEQREVRVLELHDMPQPPEKQDSGRALIDKDLTAPPPPGKSAGQPAGADKPSGPNESASPGDSTPKSAAESAPQPGKAPSKSDADVQAPKGWAVQVGSFSHQKNALALRDRLRAKKFPAFVDAVRSDGATVYRVRVGPEVRRADAEALQKRLDKYIKGKTLVVAHP
ncbi:MAG TPA: SPOR domain-containing protein [Gammaproteobacteria bacterium]|nr:SPOR domain-containing protein [Gammaproteobacteria bacterium]